MLVLAQVQQKAAKAKKNVLANSHPLKKEDKGLSTSQSISSTNKKVEGKSQTASGVSLEELEEHPERGFANIVCVSGLDGCGKTQVLQLMQDLKRNR
jgi:hypothetical protein